MKQVNYGYYYYNYKQCYREIRKPLVLKAPELEKLTNFYESTMHVMIDCVINHDTNL